MPDREGNAIAPAPWPPPGHSGVSPARGPHPVRDGKTPIRLTADPSLNIVRPVIFRGGEGNDEHVRGHVSRVERARPKRGPGQVLITVEWELPHRRLPRDIRARIETLPLERVAEGCAKMMRDEARFRMVLTTGIK